MQKRNQDAYMLKNKIATGINLRALIQYKDVILPV